MDEEEFTNELKAISATDDELVVANYIVLFGGCDLSAFPYLGATRAAFRNRDGSKGEHFSKATQLESEYTAAGRLEVDFEHGSGELDDEVLGYVDWASKRVDDKGVFVKRVLDRRKAYVKWLEELIRAGLVGNSSQAVPQGVRKAANGELTVWPLYRDTLTMTPYEPRMLGENVIAAMKALGIDPTQTNTQDPAENGSTVSPAASASDQPETPATKGLTEMDVEMQKAVADAVAAAFKAQTDAQAAEAAAKAASQKAITDAIADERKKWEAEARKTRRGSYAYGGGRTSPEDRKDDFAGALKAWVKTGDKGGFSEDAFGFDDEIGQEGLIIVPTEAEIKAIKALQFARSMKASNATDMNITTAADGGDLVPTAFYPNIIARRDESMLRDRLGVRNLPGQGTTEDVPVDNEADGEFVSTSEAATFDLDAPAVAKKQTTLVLYSKYTDISYQLLTDTPTALEAFLADFVGRGMAKTHNSLLLTEVASGGTSLKTFASATAIAAGEIEGIVSNDDLSAYLEDDGSISFVTRSSTHWAIKALTGNPRLYGSDQGADGRSLLGYPVRYSQKAAAVAASAKSIYFGNWYYVGYREAPGITFIRDPYTVAVKGQVRLMWHFRTVYKTLQAEAIGYAVHPSA